MSMEETTTHEPDGDMAAKAATAGGLLGALAMTSCCILPLVLVSFGVGGVWIAQLTALYAYKWFTFSMAVLFIGYGFYRVAKAEKASCGEGAICARPVNRKLMRGSLWGASIVTAIAMIFPYLTPYILSY